MITQQPPKYAAKVPAAMEVPPGVLGPVDDAFFRWVTDVGFTGPDRGQGGRYLFLPPGHEGEVPDGYHVAPTRTYLNYVLMRAFAIDGDLAKTVAHVNQHWRLYPLKEAASSREPHFVDLSGMQYNTIHANDFSFYEELNAVVRPNRPMPSTRNWSDCGPRSVSRRASPSRQPRPTARRATGCRPCAARAGRPCCASTDRSSLGSTRRGSPATSSSSTGEVHPRLLTLGGTILQRTFTPPTTAERR